VTYIFQTVVIYDGSWFIQHICSF